MVTCTDHLCFNTPAATCDQVLGLKNRTDYGECFRWRYPSSETYISRTLSVQLSRFQADNAKRPVPETPTRRSPPKKRVSRRPIRFSPSSQPQPHLSARRSGGPKKALFPQASQVSLQDLTKKVLIYKVSL